MDFIRTFPEILGKGARDSSGRGLVGRGAPWQGEIIVMQIKFSHHYLSFLVIKVNVDSL